ncbi:hypothetical protein PMKS-003200 [Pichia membranifaciens]|uniref:Protein BTN n=1 Tax=Pichia membranifaciens TaxID=4926 RepID=A0A1Q2YJG6_9ASCO|nr:hypothetical protein PMKS-003200 [Pichia membranifaciens]
MLLSRTFISFFIFGLINNVLYVVILTAAHDLVPPTTPKSIVLLADILPAFLLKLCLPLFVNKSVSNNDGVDSKRQSVGLGINYPLRLAMIVVLSSVGIILTSLPVPLFIVLGGVVLASLSSGLGETTFLQLSHYYSNDGSNNTLKSTNVAIHGWSSGTGGAGLVGAGLVLVFTTIIKVPIDWVLRFCALMPLFHLWVFFGYLPVPTLNVSSSYSVNEDEEGLIDDIDNCGSHGNSTLVENPTMVDINIETDEILAHSKNGFFAILLPKIRQYFFIYMLPLSVVYFAEYVINQGVAPTMLFPLHQTPFTTFRDSYVAYGTIYQVGVFISRSSGSVIRLKNLYLLGLLQVINLAICILQSIFMFMPSIWIVFIIILYEGLLGGAGYVNTFMSVSEEVQSNEREFALGCVGISDSFGIVMAAGISLWLEPTLCHFQVDSGRDWCTLK